MAVLNRRDYYSAIPQLEAKFAKIYKYITIEEGKLQIKVDDLYGNLSSLTMTTEEIETRVEDAEGDISTLTQRADGFDVTITTKADASDVEALESDLEDEVEERTMLIRAFSNASGGGTITAYQGQDCGVFTNASGSVDIVSLSWVDGIPEITGTAASFHDAGMTIYGPEGNTWASFTQNGVNLLCGDVYAAYGMTTGEADSTLKVTEVNGRSTSVAGGDSSGAVEHAQPFSLSGYYPIGIVGARTGNGNIVFARYDLAIYDRTVGSAKITYNVRQIGGSSSQIYSVTPTFKVLWLKWRDHGMS